VSSAHSIFFYQGSAMPMPITVRVTNYDKLDNVLDAPDSTQDGAKVEDKIEKAQDMIK
jgi:hypothetical protein